ncbi:MAG TPA: winged helix-turn-helix domain-containing protein [bacterium]|jgi:hypothetical protein|nr:winged helix-turn-helix domain-containing protein [bacterium]
MLEALFGNPNVEKILFYLLRFREGYARGIASNFGSPLSPIQQQLKRLERGGIVVSRLAGRTRLFQLNPRYPFRKDLEALLNTSFSSLPNAQIEDLYTRRTRPRRQGKP